MPRASFSFGDNDSHTMDVDLRWWGQEEYFIDGVLAQKNWSGSLAGKREFKVGNHVVRIDVAVGPKEYFTRVYVDEKVHIEELFPEVKARVEKWKRPPRSYVAPIVIVVVCGAIGIWIARQWLK